MQAPGSRAERIADHIKDEVSQLLSFEVKDPSVGLLTVTHVKVTPDLQQARVYYTTLGDARARRDSQRALERATPFLRRQLGRRVRLRRVPELQFFFDDSVERQDRVEQILRDLDAERAERAEAPDIHERARDDEADDRDR